MRSLGMFFGALFSLLLDIKWMVLGFFFGGLLMYSCAARAEGIPDTILQEWYMGKNDESHLIIFEAQGDCPVGQHMALVHELGELETGCAIVRKDGFVHVQWKHGGEFTIPVLPLEGWRPGPRLLPSPLNGVRT